MINPRKREVKGIQFMLKKVLNRSLSVDGDYGPSTRKAVKEFQYIHGLVVDGIYGVQTDIKLRDVYRILHKTNSELLSFGEKRFVVFVDAGHGGINEKGIYVTPGKRAYHKGTQLHERGHYYEGYENRLAAEAFIDKCMDVGIMCIRTYHPYKDTSLSDRTNIIRSWLRRGYYGYLHSFHSNAISSKNAPSKLERTRGFMVFSTTKTNRSDLIATRHFQHVKEEIGADNWHFRTQMKDGDIDFEANFQILRETDLIEFEDSFGAILEEWGFHSSKTDAQFIVNPETRIKRVNAAFKTAFWYNALALKEA